MHAKRICERDIHVAAAAVSVMTLLASVEALAASTAAATWSREAPAASATLAHCAATRAAADATAVSLIPGARGGAAFSAAMAASAAATPATDTAAWTSARCRRASSLRFCLRSLTHFLSEIPFHGGILRGSCTPSSEIFKAWPGKAITKYMAIKISHDFL